MIPEPQVQELCCNILVGTTFFNVGVIVSRIEQKEAIDLKGGIWDHWEGEKGRII